MTDFTAPRIARIRVREIRLVRELGVVTEECIEAVGVRWFGQMFIKPGREGRLDVGSCP